MKEARVVVDSCRECPFSEESTISPRIKLCCHQDDKQVRADEIDESCPLDDFSLELTK